MPEKGTLWGLLPWLLGLVAAIVGVALRNEWTTNQMKNILFRPNGEVRLVRIRDCEACRVKCQEGVEKALATAKLERAAERKEFREDIRAMRDAIDDLPQRIMSLIRAA
jgi:hypothetical protein